MTSAILGKLSTKSCWGLVYLVKYFKEYNFYDPLLTEALINLQVAKNQFNNANTPDMVDIAIYELSAAELHLKAVLKRVRDESKKEFEH